MTLPFSKGSMVVQSTKIEVLSVSSLPRVAKGSTIGTPIVDVAFKPSA
jgi:hypothetical protein